MGSIKDHEITLTHRIFWLLNTIVHIVIILTSGFMFYIFFKYNSNYAYTRFLHVFLCTFAYVPLMAEALLLFSESDVWNLQLSRFKKTLIHGALLGSSVIISTVGISIKINSKTRDGLEHFKSNHAILGLVSWILCFVSVAGGIIVFYSPQLKKLIRPVILKLIHIFLGLSAFIIGMASLILALDLPAFNTYTTSNEKLTITVFLSLITILCSASAIQSAVNQFSAIIP